LFFFLKHIRFFGKIHRKTLGLQNVNFKIKQLMRKFVSVLLMMCIFCTTSVIACTNFLVTKGASVDGSNMITYAADAHVLYGELYHWPAATYPEGSMLDVYEWDTGKYLGKIRQVPKTYNVVGNMNELQVTIGETTYGGRQELATQTGAIMDYGSLIYIALQRSKTAREAIKVIAELMEEYGYYSSGESFSIADKNEVWLMELIGKGEGEKGAVWVALRIPDGYVSAHANQARITTFPLANGKTSITSKDMKKLFDKDVECIYSHDVIEFARKKEWFSGKDKDFSFSDTYAPVDFGGARFCEMRVWAFFRQINSQMEQYKDYAAGHNLANRMPLWIKPDKKISVHDLMNYMRDYLQGTEFDMSKDFGAGSFGCPYRWRPLTFKVGDETYVNERATVTQQTGFSFVTQSRSWLPDVIGGILWFGVDDAGSCVYTPMYCSMVRIPETYAVGNGAMMEFSWNSAFWIFNLVSNFAYTRYNIIHPDIHERQQYLEKKFIVMTETADKEAQELYNKNPEEAVKYLTNFSVTTANELVYGWKKFFEDLFLKYMDGNIKYAVPGEKNPKVEFPGYNDDWKKRLVEDTGDKLKMR
jgi:dipeptidase